MNQIKDVMRFRILPQLVFCGLLAAGPAALGQGTAFTYQGRLTTNGTLANGDYDLTFGLFTAATGGTQVGGTVTNPAVAVSNGLFTATVDFGEGAFSGPGRWLEIGVRPTGSTGAFTALSPLQEITPAPYAITASNLSGTLPVTQLPPAVVTNNTSGVTLSGAFTGNGQGLTNLSSSNLSGTISAALLGTNVALLKSNQTFSASNTFLGVVILTNAANALAGNGAGLTGVPSVTQSNYLSAYDATIQSLATADTYQNITFSSPAVYNSGWIYSPATGQFTAPQNGLYFVQYSAVVFNQDSSQNTILAETRVVDTGTVLEGSQCWTYPVFGTFVFLSQSFIVQMTAGQYLLLQWTAAGTSELYTGNLLGDSVPSATFKVVRIQ
jgi:C1q domain